MNIKIFEPPELLIRSKVAPTVANVNEDSIYYGQLSAREVLSVQIMNNGESTPSYKFLVFPLMLLRSRVIAVETSHDQK